MLLPTRHTRARALSPRGTPTEGHSGLGWCVPSPVRIARRGARSPASPALMSNRRSPTGMPTDTIRKEVRRSMVRHNSRRARQARRRLDNRRSRSRVRLHGGSLRHGELSAAAFAEVSRGQRFGFALDAAHDSLPWPPNSEGRWGQGKGPASHWNGLFFREDLCNQRSRRPAGDKFRHLAGAKYRKLALRI